MEDFHPADDLRELAKALLNIEHDLEKEEEIIDRIHELLSEVSMVSGFDEVGEWQKHLQTTSGLAISVNEAALCLLDYRRTGQFMRGLYHAIKKAQNKFPGKTIEILYAGCGPYAPFVLLMASLFSHHEIRFTLIELNGESLSAARTLISDMGMEKYVGESHQADATVFQLPEPKIFHLLFSETMDAALEQEPMVPILMNLLPQFRKDGFVVPKNVTVDGAFYKEAELKKGMDGLWDLDCEDEGFTIGNVIDMNDLIRQAVLEKRKVGDKIMLAECEVPQLNEWNYLALATTVEIWDDIFLYKNESDITDLRVRDLDDLPEGNRVRFYYCLEEKPEVRFGVG